MVMSGNNIREYLVFSFTVLSAVIVELTGFPVAMMHANAAQASAAVSATFRTKCATCHGPDGGGSEVGKTMNVPDLRSPEVQHLTNAELAQIISDGKMGMPSFKGSLSTVQIQSLVKYVRALGKKK
jgi:cytochrome c6